MIGGLLLKYVFYVIILLHQMHSLYPHGVQKPSFLLRSTSYLSEDPERLQKRAMTII